MILIPLPLVLQNTSNLLKILKYLLRLLNADKRNTLGLLNFFSFMPEVLGHAAPIEQGKSILMM